MWGMRAPRSSAASTAASSVRHLSAISRACGSLPLPVSRTFLERRDRQLSDGPLWSGASGGLIFNAWATVGGQGGKGLAHLVERLRRANRIVAHVRDDGLDLGIGGRRLPKR